MQFRNDIQGLRAVAFLLVFFFHLNRKWVPGGFVGVDMFFVISGYLITSILMKQKKRGTFSFLAFYEKRIKRIVPAHFVMLILVLIVGFFVFLSFDYTGLRGSTLRSALFISNMLWADGRSYFGVGLTDNPLLHTWSLSIEMQFYLILPLILVFINDRLLPWVLGIGIVLLTGYSTYQMVVNHVTAGMYFSLIARIPEFFIGCLLSLVFDNRAPLSRKAGFIAGSIGTLMVLLSAFLINEHTFFPGVTALVPTLGAGLLLVSGKNLFTDFLSTKPMVHIGELSYSLYLWHWPVMAMMRYQDARPVAYDFSVGEILFIVAATYLLSWLSYRFIENAFRATGNRRFVLVFSPIVALLLVLAFTLPVISTRRGVPEEWSRATMGLESHGQNYVQTFGDTASTTTAIFLFGDSHALVLKPFLDFLGREHGFAFRTMTSDAIPPIAGINRDELSDIQKKYFDVSRGLVEATAKEIAKSDIIIMSTVGFDQFPSMETAVGNLANSLRADQTLVIINTFPVLDRNPLRKNKSTIKNTDCRFQVVDKSRNKELIKKIVSQHHNVVYYDLSKSKVFKSPPFYDGSIMYYDNAHLNIFGSVSMAKDLDSDFMLLLSRIILERQYVKQPMAAQ